MRFLPICVSALLLAGGAGWSYMLLERVRPADLCIAVLGVVLTLALLAYMATDRKEKASWVRFGLYGAAAIVCGATIWAEIVRPVLGADSLGGFLRRLARLDGYELALIAVPLPGFMLTFVSVVRSHHQQPQIPPGRPPPPARRVRSLRPRAAARPALPAPPRQTPGHPARPVGRGPQRQADRLVPGRLRHHRGAAPRRQGRHHRAEPAVARLPGLPGIDRHH